MDHINATQSDKYIVNNHGSIVKHLQLQSNWIKVSQGDHLRLMASGGALATNLIASRVGDDLVVLFDDGTSIVFMGYFACPVSADDEDADSCSVTLAGDDEPYVVPAGAGYASSNAQVIYHQGQFGHQMPKKTALGEQLAQSQDETVAELSTQELTEVEPAVGGGLLLPALAGGGLLVGAAAGGGASAVTATAAVVTNIAGSVVLGPLIAGHGVSVYAYAKDGTALGFTRVADDGSYQLTLNQAYSGYVILKAVDASDGDDYRDEASKSSREMTTDLRAIVKVAAGTNVTAMITPITEMAVLELNLAAGDGGRSKHLLNSLSDADLGAINTTVARAFGLADIDITAHVPSTTVDRDGNATNNADAYGNILAAVSGMESNASKSTQQILAQLAAGLSAGNLNADLKQELLAGARTGSADVTSVGSALNVANTQAIVASWEVLEDMHKDGSSSLLSTDNLASLGIDNITEADQLSLFNETIKQLPQAETNSVGELASLAEAVVRVKSIGQTGASSPTRADYGRLGFSAINTDPEAALLTDLLQQKGYTNYDDIDNRAGAVARLFDYLTNGAAALTKPEVDLLGLDNLSASDLPLFNHLLSQQQASDLDSLADLTACWSNGSIQHNHITTIANASIADAATSLDLAVYSGAAINGVSNHNLGLINSLFSHADFKAPTSAATGEILSVNQQIWLQNHVDVLAKIATWVDNPNAGSDYEITLAEVERLGYDNVSVQGLAYFQSIIANREDETDLNTANGVLAVINALEKLALLANGSGATSFTAANSLTHEEYTVLGMTAVDDGNKAHFLNLLLDVQDFGTIGSWRVGQQIDQAIEHWFANGAAGVQDPLSLADLGVLGLDSFAINGENLVVTSDHMAAVEAQFQGYNITSTTSLSDIETLFRTLITKVNTAIEALRDYADDNDASSNADLALHLDNIVFYDPLVDSDAVTESLDLTVFRELLNTAQLSREHVNDWVSVQGLIIATEYQQLASGDLSSDLKVTAETMLFGDVLSHGTNEFMLAADNQSAVFASVSKAMDLVALDPTDVLTPGQKLTALDLTNLGIRSTDVAGVNAAIVALANDQWQSIDSVAELNALAVL